MLILERESELHLDLTMSCTKITTLLSSTMEKKDIVFLVRSAILNTARAFKFSENMTPMQAFVLAEDLIDKMKYETIEDILLLLKMGRRGELGSNKGRFDHDVLFTLFVPAYLDKKAEQYEKVNEFVVVDDVNDDVPMTKLQVENLEKLYKSFKSSAKRKEQQSFETVDYHANFMTQLPSVVHRLSDRELVVEIKRAKQHRLNDVLGVYEYEQKRREENKMKDKLKQLQQEMDVITAEAKKGAKVYGLFNEPIESLLKGLAKQIKQVEQQIKKNELEGKTT